MKLKNAIYICTFLMLFNMKAQDINGTYAIKNVQTSLVLRIKDAQIKDGTPLVAYRTVKWKCVTWEFQKVQNQTYRLKNLFTGKTFQVKGNHPEVNSRLEQQPLAENEIQYYQFISAGNDSYYIKLLGTDLYLTPGSPVGKVNSPIILANKIEGGNLQKWVINEQHPTM